VTARRVEVGDFTDEQLRVQRAGEALHRDGASPAGALELLAALVEDQTWERLADIKGRSFKGRFRDFVEARSPFGLGYDPDQLPKVLALRHPHESVPAVAYRMATMRQEVQALLLSEISTASEHRGRTVTERATKDMTHNSTVTPSTERERVVSRLKRDDPELAERVICNEVSSYEAQRAKGWKPPRIYVTAPERIADALRKYMPRDALLRLAELLTKEN
jgi:hypothetical protein